MIPCTKDANIGITGMLCCHGIGVIELREIGVIARCDVNITYNATHVVIMCCVMIYYRPPPGGGVIHNNTIPVF